MVTSACWTKHTKHASRLRAKGPASFFHGSPLVRWVLQVPDVRVKDHPIAMLQKERQKKEYMELKERTKGMEFLRLLR